MLLVVLWLHHSWTSEERNIMSSVNILSCIPVLGGYRSVSKVMMASVELYKLHVRIPILHYPWIFVNYKLKTWEPWRKILWLKYSEFNSQRPQKKIKIKFNRTFVRVSKFTRYDTKFTRYDTKFTRYDTKFTRYDTKFVRYDTKYLTNLTAISIHGTEFFLRSWYFLGGSNSEHFMELQIYYHIYNSQVN